MSTPIKKYDTELIDSINVRITETSHPQVFKQKLVEMVKSGLSEADAKVWISQTEFELELYYSPDLGMFAVESEAVENADIFDPYTGVKMVD